MSENNIQQTPDTTDNTSLPATVEKAQAPAVKPMSKAAQLRAKRAARNKTQQKAAYRKARRMVVPAAPLNLIYRQVTSRADGSRIGRVTELRIRSVKYGLLMPEDYSFVANRNIQSEHLCTWVLGRVLEKIRTDTKFNGWYSVYCPWRFLKSGKLEKLLASAVQQSNINTERLVIELSTEVLFADTEEVVHCLLMLRSVFGVRFMLGEYGDEYCPLLRINSLPVDFVKIDKSINTEKALTGQSVSEMLSVAAGKGRTVILGATNGARLKGILTGDQPGYYLGPLVNMQRRKLK